MRNFILTTTIALMAINLGLYAQEKDTAQGESQIKLELVWEKEFTEPIVDYIAQLNKKDKVVLRFISTAGRSKYTLYFNDTEGDCLRKIDFASPPNRDSAGNWIWGVTTYILKSKNEQYLGVVQGPNSDWIDKVSFVLYDINGVLRWKQQELNARPFWLLSTGLYLSAEGYMSWSPVTLRNKETIIDTLLIIPSKNEVMSTGAIDVSQNDYIVFNVYDVDNKDAHVILYNSTGQEIWRKKFTNWTTASKVCISDNGRYICARGGFANTLFTFSNDGTLLWQKHIGVGYLQTFSSDGRYIAAIGPLNRILYFDTENGDSLWSFVLSADRSFFALAVSDRGNFIVAADGEGKRENPVGTLSTLFLFDKKGNVIWRREFTTLPYTTPNVRFVDDGHLLIHNGNKFYCYKIIGGAQ